MSDEKKPMGLVGEGQMVMREKNWEELSDAEKIERMRGEVKRLQRKCNQLE